VCATRLEYLTEAVQLSCGVCGRLQHGHIRCPRGHFVCYSCYNLNARDKFAKTALTTSLSDPLEIAEAMMSDPGLPMLGCQHAYVAAGALLAALRQEPAHNISEAKVAEVFSRIDKQAHGGYCGLTGVCGVAPAVGAVFAILLGARCGSGREQRITMEAVTRTCRAITELTGPSCCKAYVRASLVVAVEYLQESLGIALPHAYVVASCDYVADHPHGCREGDCPYFLG
jgi:hypothetical protein